MLILFRFCKCIKPLFVYKTEVQTAKIVQDISQFKLKFQPVLQTTQTYLTFLAKSCTGFSSFRLIRFRQIQTRWHFIKRNITTTNTSRAIYTWFYLRRLKLQMIVNTLSRLTIMKTCSICACWYFMTPFLNLMRIYSIKVYNRYVHNSAWLIYWC